MRIKLSAVIVLSSRASWLINFRCNIAVASVPSTPKIQFTYEDYLELPDDGKIYEIIDGELYMSTSPTPNHQTIVHDFSFTLIAYLRGHPIGKVFPAPLEVYFSEINLTRPDIMFISNEHLDIIKPTQIKGAPDLVIEELSPNTEKRDRTVKLKMYAKLGVEEYWMAREKTTTIQIFRPREGKLVPVARLGKTDMLTSPLFPGLEIPLDEIFNLRSQQF
jgi:Uma2 family endonuclease